MISAARWLKMLRQWTVSPTPPPAFPPRIGLALGGGFARGIAHVGVLRVLHQNQIPVTSIAGVSAGSIVAAAYASGADPEQIARVGSSMRFADIARWSIGRMGFAGSERMLSFLERLLKSFRFEEMRIPLGIVATDLATGKPAVFRDQGDVGLAIRASCSYPGLFQPVRDGDRLLVDGAMSVEIPAHLTRSLGATKTICVQLPMQGAASAPHNMFQVVNRCFQIMQSRLEEPWRRHADLVITPDVRGMQWDSFHCAEQMIEAGEKAALEALPQIRAWLAQPQDARGAAARPRSGSNAVSGGLDCARRAEL